MDFTLSAFIEFFSETSSGQQEEELDYTLGY